ncbi:MAG: hypothetical protein QOE70_4175 [Chthoniobacter sp.]|nr:hypothetical protein [Chthoniobacter sp.]
MLSKGKWATLVVVVVLVGLFAWPAYGPGVPSVVFRNLSYAKQLGLAAKLYAADHQGRYPVHLSEVMPDYLPADAWKKMLFEPMMTSQTTAPARYDWIYFGAFTDENKPPRILIASPQAITDSGKSRRVVINGNISGEIMDEGRYQEELRQTIVDLNKRILAQPASETDDKLPPSGVPKATP